MPTGRVESVQPSLGLYFTDEPPTRKTYTLILRERSIDIPAGESDHVVEESIALPCATQVLGLYPHAHYLARDMRIVADLPDGNSVGLLRIPDWDFNWQRDYRFETPVPLPSGTTIRMRYTYDNSSGNPRNPSDPPRSVSLGWNSTDEMAEVAIQLLLNHTDDLTTIADADARYRMAAMGRARFLLSVAETAKARGDSASAEKAYRAALEDDPAFVPAMTGLGSLAEKQWLLDAAGQWFQQAAKIEPATLSHRIDIARVQNKAGDGDAAADLLTGVLSEHPESSEARLMLAHILTEARRYEEALGELQTGLVLQPGANALHLETAKTLLRMRRTAEATQHLRMAMRSSEPPDTLVPDASAVFARSDAHVIMAMILHQGGRDDEAADDLRAALAQVPEHRGALLMLAVLAADEGDEYLTADHLVRVLALPHDRLSPEDLLAALPQPIGSRALARACARSGDPDAARRIVERARELEIREGRQDRAEALTSLGAELGL